MATTESAARRQQQEAESPAPMMQTPSRFRTPDRKLAQRSRAMANEFAMQRKQPDDGYSFNVLPKESLPMTPGSARKRRQNAEAAAAGSSDASMMAVEELPTRYSPDKIQDAVMSFADFLRFLEQNGNQQEHQLMPMIIQRFSELGAVIESQKRHIDRWKQRELELAISEHDQHLELARELEATIAQKDGEIGLRKVEAQQWEEKYLLAAQANDALNARLERGTQEHAAVNDALQRANQQIESLKRDGTAQIQALMLQVEQLTQQLQEFETAVHERDEALETTERDAATLRTQMQQLERERAQAASDNDQLHQQQQQQGSILQQLEQQVAELQHTCHAEQQRAASLEQDVATWQRKLQTQEQTTTELEHVLDAERRARGEQTGSLTQWRTDAQRLQARLDASTKDYDEKLAAQQQMIEQLEANRRGAVEQLTQASDKYNALLHEAAQQHEAASAAAMRQLEDRFLAEKNRLSEQLQQQLATLQHELTAAHQEIRRLTTSQQQLVVQYEQQPRPEDVETMEQLQEELEKATSENNELHRELNEKDAMHEEDLNYHRKQFEVQYNEFVAQAANKLDNSLSETEQLRIELEDVTAEYKRVLHDAEELARAKDDDAQQWHAEATQLRSKSDAAEQQVAELQHELERVAAEHQQLHKQLQQAAQNDASDQQLEQLEQERLRLEEQVHDLRQQLDAKSGEANGYATRAIELESAHRQTIRSLYAEKEETSRNVAALTKEKAALERQLHATARDNDELTNAKRTLELKLQELMTEATATLQTQQQNATLSNQDARAQLEHLTNELHQRDEQLRRGEAQLQQLQSTIQRLESRIQQLERDLESASTWNARLKATNATLQSETRAAANDKQRALDDVTTRFELTKSELLSRIIDEEHKVSDLQTQRSADDAQHVEQMTDALAQLQATQSALEALEDQYHELEREHEALNHDITEQRRILEQAAQLEVQHTELQHIYAQLQTEFANQNADSATTIGELEEHAAQLQSALEREQQHVQQLVSQSHAAGGSHQQAVEQLTRMREHGRALEQANEQLRRQVQASDEHRAAKEQGQLHETLAKERELRTVQSRCSGLEQQVAALQRELMATAQQSDEWRRALDERRSEIDDLRRKAEVTAAELQRDADAQRQALEAQIDELVASQDALETAKQHVEDELHLVDEQLAARDVELQDKSEQIDALERAQQSHETSRDADERATAANLAAYERDADDRIAQLATKDSIIDNLHDVNQQQLEQLEDKDSELAALSRANTSHMQQLAAKDDELSALARENRRHASELHKATSALAALERDYDAQTRTLETLEAQSRLSHGRNERANDTAAMEAKLVALEAKLVALQRKCDAGVARESVLEADVATLRAENRDIANAVSSELQRLELSDGVSRSAGAVTTSSSSSPTMSGLRQELAQVVDLVQRLQNNQTRHKALVRRKDAQLADLTEQVQQLRATAATNARVRHTDSAVAAVASSIKSRATTAAQTNSTLERELARQSDELARLTLENCKLRDSSSDSNAAASSRRIADEWERQYPQLQAQVRELVAENALLKSERVSKREVKRLVAELDTLTALVQRKDEELDALRRRTTAVSSRHSTVDSAGPSSNPSPRDSRRMRELMQLVQQKETKILVLNDHLTELMTHAARLQLENECYATEFGDLRKPLKRPTTSASANPAARMS